MDACCEKPSAPTLQVGCPSCATAGRPVKATTLRSLVDPGRQLDLETDFRFCPAHACPVVYFDVTGTTVMEADLRVPVWQKREDVTVPVCYCFGWTEERIRSEIEETGKSTAVSSISAQVKAGACTCEISNPQGSCCLGNVSAVVKRLPISR